MMNESKRKRLAEKGWKVGSAEEFLQLSADEVAYIDLKIRLSDSLRIQRQQRNMTQVQLARLIKSSQSRIAKMESGDASVSLDLLIRSLLALGASNQDIASIINR